MKLANAVRRDQIDALQRFISAPQHKALNDFSGTIINLRTTILEAGFKKPGDRVFMSDKVPKLAVCNLDVRQTLVHIQNGRLRFICDNNEVLMINVAFSNNNLIWGTGTPLPPKEMTEHVPQIRGARPPLILFESGEWVSTGRVSPPVEDPALIQHLVGDLWGVLYTWELTPLEKEALRAIGV
jgi:hypothetical protein